MEVRTIDVNDLKGLVGQELGVSPWYLVTQDEINLFADATHDHQWIHVDPERARRESPFGGPIAHGYYTLSLAPYLISQTFVVTGIRMGVNYGIDRLRFPSPLKIGQSVRARVKLENVDDVAGGVQALLQVTWESDGGIKPVCAADVLYRYYP
jgi:acyl dehydratase